MTITIEATLEQDCDKEYLLSLIWQVVSNHKPKENATVRLEYESSTITVKFTH